MKCPACLIAVILLALLAVASCEKLARLPQWQPPPRYNVLCIDGVQYLTFPVGASVKYTLDGRVEQCPMKGSI